MFFRFNVNINAITREYFQAKLMSQRQTLLQLPEKSLDLPGWVLYPCDLFVSVRSSLGIDDSA